MPDSRSEILGKLSPGGASDADLPAIIQPGFAADSDSGMELFKLKLEAVQASVDILDGMHGVGDSIAAFLRAQGCPLEVGLVPASASSSLPETPGLHYYDCSEFSDCTSVLTHAALGIAETGTLVLPSSVQRPTLANFLPDNCIILLEESCIVACMEEALLRIQQGVEGMPRALNLISGPSKTADIEQTLAYGAHGPIQLHVIVIR